jgi:hypothetical protein
MPSPVGVARGAAHQARLSLARRFDDRPWLQGRLDDRALGSADRWCGARVDPIPALHAAEASRWSQNGEDGLLAELVRRVGPGERTFVEIGSSDGGENCTRALAEDGWRGAWFEGDPDRAAAARKVVDDLDVEVTRALVTSGNVAELLADHGVGPEPTVAVVDIDGSDLWVLRAMLGAVSPRIVVVEYNSSFPPGVFWTRRNRSSYSWPETYEHGASLDAMVWAAGGAGYGLVACDRAGVNAFFVREDLLAGSGLDVQPVERVYRPLLEHRPIIGHPWRIPEVTPVLTVDERSRVTIVDARVVFEHASTNSADGRLVGVRAMVRNDTGRRLSSGRPNPVSLSARLVDAEGVVLDHECERNLLIGGIRPRSTTPVAGIFDIVDPAARTLRLMVVQDGVAWFDHGGCDVPLV